MICNVHQGGAFDRPDHEDNLSKLRTEQTLKTKSVLRFRVPRLRTHVLSSGKRSGRTARDPGLVQQSHPMIERTTANVAAHTARNRGQQRFPEGDHLECTDAQCRKVSLAFQLPVNPGFLPACLLQLNFNAAPMRLKYHALRKLMRGYDSHRHILRAIEGQAHRKFPLRMHGDRC